MLDFDNTGKKGAVSGLQLCKHFLVWFSGNHHQQQQVYFYCTLKEIFTRNIIKNNTYSNVVGQPQ